VAALAAESADDALPFELDVEEDGFAARDGAGGAVATFRETSESDPDAAVAALVRALRDAPPLGLEPGSGGAPSSAETTTMTLAGAKRRLAAMRRGAAVARRHRGGASSGTSSSSRASSDAEKREAPPRPSSIPPGSAPAPAPRMSDGEKKTRLRLRLCAPTKPSADRRLRRSRSTPRWMRRWRSPRSLKVVVEPAEVMCDAPL
jgi:hypothetical protein